MCGRAADAAAAAAAAAVEATGSVDTRKMHIK